MERKARTIMDLAQMITGGSGHEDHPVPPGKFFPYRSGPQLTRFFTTCDTEHRHEGSRVPWTEGVLMTMNKGPSTSPDMPADGMIRVIQELMDPVDFTRVQKDRDAALTALNESLGREGLTAYLDGAGQCHLRTAASTTATMDVRARAFNQKDRETRTKWASYLDTASEDDFTGKVLVPLFRSCGFQRLTVAGHTDKLLEYGKDIWMKYRLPTSQFIYFGIQVKKGKLDSSGRTKPGNENVTEALNQIRMALQNPVMDPEINKKVLIDHVFLIASGDITKAARNFLGEHLDIEARRQVLFMDRDEILDLLVYTNLELPVAQGDSDIPF